VPAFALLPLTLFSLPPPPLPDAAGMQNVRQLLPVIDCKENAGGCEEETKQGDEVEYRKEKKRE